MIERFGAFPGTQPLARLQESPSQTAGPYVHIGLTPNAAGIAGVFPSDLGSGPTYADGAGGERVALHGRVLDGLGAPLRDALVEIWHADAAGRYPSRDAGSAGSSFAGSSSGNDPDGVDPHVTGFARRATDNETGEYRFEIVKPGRVPFGDGRLQAPHVTFWIVARGINVGLHTRLYFADEAEANAEDPLLGRIDHRQRLETLIAAREGDGYRFDVHLQGERETVFLDI